LAPILSYDRACTLWAENAELKGIKLLKYKEVFAKCNICWKFDKKVQSPMTIAEKEALDTEFHAHIAETRKERAQYYKSRVKAMESPHKYLSVIVDAMDQRKTCFPYFCNPPKNIANEFVLKLKLIGAIVHGIGNFVDEFCFILLQPRKVGGFC
jgi:hypothetical protein